MSTCGSGFLTTVNVFEGTELAHLTSLFERPVNGDEGPALARPPHSDRRLLVALAIQMKVPPAIASGQASPCACVGTADSSSSPPPSQVPPAVKVASHRVDAVTRTATFRFGSPTPGTTFRCKVDRRSYRDCSSPFEVKGLTPGKHRFQMLAGIHGTWGVTPATVKFTVPAPHRRQHAAG